MRSFYRSILTLAAIACLSFAAQAEADEETNAYVRTTANASADANFTLTRDIFVTHWYTQQVCQDVTYNVPQTCYQQQWVPNMVQEWVPNNVMVCNTDPDGNQQCSWVDQGYYQTVDRGSTQSVPYSCDTTEVRNECHDEQYSREDYDHTWTQPVVVHFPAEATLREGETETILFELSGSEHAPAIDLNQKSAVLHYAIAASKNEGGKLDVTLVTKPYLTLAEVGPANIGNPAIEFDDQQSVVSFTDKFSRLRVDSTYTVSVAEKGSSTVLASGSASASGGKNLSVTFPVVLDPSKNYDISIETSRSGIVLVSSPIVFTVKKTVKAELLDQAKLKSKALLGSYSLAGLKDKLVFRFKDLSPNYATVSSSYQLQVSQAGPDKKPVVIGSASISRKTQKTDSAGRILVSLADDFKVDPAVLATLGKGKTLTFSLVATRHSRRFSPDIVLSRTVSLAVQK